MLHTPIYLDYAATTPMDSRVLTAMQPFLQQEFGNPASYHHRYGWQAEAAVERARQQIAQAIGAQSAEMIFTSGATEANNLAIKGLAQARGSGHLITALTEHSSVLETMKSLERRGFRVSYLPVNHEGKIELSALAESIGEDTFLISIMWVNNETGYIQEIEEIGKLCRKHQVFFHVDAAQALGKVPIDVQKAQIDLLSLSAHKVYGPKGIGVLYKRRCKTLHLEAQIHGGGQEQGLRSGTLPVAQIVGMGEAIQIAVEQRVQDWQYAQRLHHLLQQALNLPFVYCNHNLNCAPHYFNISVEHLDAQENLLLLIEDIALSNGSACHSAYLAPSYVLQAMGRDEALARHSLRLSFGRFTTEQEMIQAGKALAALLVKLQKPSIYGQNT